MPSSLQSSKITVSFWPIADWANLTWALVKENFAPPFLPLALAAVKAAFVRSLINSRSNSAKAAKIPRINFPLEVLINSQKMIVKIEQQWKNPSTLVEFTNYWEIPNLAPGFLRDIFSETLLRSLIGLTNIVVRVFKLQCRMANLEAIRKQFFQCTFNFFNLG